MVLFAVIGYAIVRQITPTYTADAALMVETQQLSLPNFQQFTNPFAVTPGDPSAVMRSEIAVIRSRPIIETVIMELGLTREREANPYLRPPGGVGQWLASLRGAAAVRAIVDVLDGIGLRLPLPLARTPTEEEITDATVRGVLQRLDVANDSRSFIITLGYHSENPQLAARILNSLMDTYITAQIAAKLQATADANAWLNERIVQLRREVEAADQDVQAYRLRYGLVDTRMGTVTQQQVAEINTQMVMAEAEAAATEATLRSAGNGSAARATVESPLISRLRDRQAEIVARQSDLTTRLGRDHPQRQVIQNEPARPAGRPDRHRDRARPPVARRPGDGRALARRRLARAARAPSRAAPRATPRPRPGWPSLPSARPTASARSISGCRRPRSRPPATPRSNQADARIITAAVAPSNPTGPRTTLRPPPAAGWSACCCAAAAALLLAELDRGFERADTARSRHRHDDLGRAAPGALEAQHQEPGRLRDPQPGVRRRGDHSRFRRGAAPHGRRAGTKVVLVTSSLAGEGKTSLAAAMGRLLAKDGRRVLLSRNRRIAPMSATSEAGRSASSP